MKIAIYSHSIAPSIDGVCRRFTGILHEMEKQGYETLLFTMEEFPLELPKSTKTVTLDHIIFPTYPNKKVAWPTLKSFASILFTLRRETPDVIHVVADGFSQMFALAGLLLGIPVVGSFHTDIIDLLSTHGAYAVQKLCVLTKEAVDSVVLDSCATTSTSFMKKLAKQGVYCEHVVITAVDTLTFSESKRNESLRKELMFGDESGFLCVYVGRISNEKRLDIVIDVMRKLSGPRKAYLAIVGDGPSAPVYAQLHGPEHRVHCQPRFLSHAELAEVYASSDVHVSASEFETLGNTVLEAFSCGVPVVVPRTQGFRDTVRHEVDGFLFNPGDRQDATRYLQLLKDDDALRVSLGAAGRNTVSTRTISFVVRDLLQWYVRGAQRRAGRSAAFRVLWTAALSVLVPFTIFLFFLYNITVNVILKPYITHGGYAHTAPSSSPPTTTTTSSSSMSTSSSTGSVQSKDINSSSSSNEAARSSRNSSNKCD